MTPNHRRPAYPDRSATHSSCSAPFPAPSASLLHPRQPHWFISSPRIDSTITLYGNGTRLAHPVRPVKPYSPSRDLQHARLELRCAILLWCYHGFNQGCCAVLCVLASGRIDLTLTAAAFLPAIPRVSRTDGVGHSRVMHGDGSVRGGVRPVYGAAAGLLCRTAASSACRWRRPPDLAVGRPLVKSVHREPEQRRRNLHVPCMRQSRVSARRSPI